ncbi:MAG: valine--tRNA ligase [Oscillospiraceae bacterium]|jgi:valyl-tRNA synthetase|nr:valine--tRNA ligase [Oscillospiraceae bacterium]
MRELPKQYDPKDTESRIYQLWADGGYFRGVVDTDKEPFSIVIPPPNVTGQLHLGHAFDNTVQDILTRWKRMSGYAAVWIPGTDHAGIATQIKVEEELRKEGLTRYDLGREAFTARVWDWKNKYGSRIIEQLKLLGSSCDWSRERFTMDEGCSAAVREVFVRLYEKGLIYKGKRIINWCPDCTTALSDAEVEHEEEPGKLWHIRYPFSDGSGYLTIATTRPETMLGDTAVAVNPADERYTALIGRTLTLPLVGREIPVIADDYVETDFGSGCVKITPCHDPNDFEVGQRHNLPQVLIMDDNAKIINGGDKYNGLDRYEARKLIVADLTELGLLEKIEEHVHNVGKCYRCGTTVEPITSPQWFVKMEPLAKPAIDVVREGKMKFVPERFSKIYLNWMENVRDWCVSRQLWWGHQIPAWYCADCGEITVSRTDPDKCGKCGSTNIERDPDVLDTWFSSALWPFEVFGWPEKTPELDFWYPTTVVTPGYDIIFFWVARMIFSGVEHMGDVPFHTAYIHGLVRDEQGRKMQKSLGNGVDPQEIIDKYGADALRMNMISGSSPGNDMRFVTAKCENYRNFANKLWNASRYVMMNLDKEQPERTTDEDRWILGKLNRLAGSMAENLEAYDLGIAAGKIYDFIYDDFCDWYIELSKSGVNPKVLTEVLSGVLKLLHPFMPFITEEIWQTLKNGESALIVESYPLFDAEFDKIAENQAAFVNIEALIAAVRALRSVRAEKNVPAGTKSALYIVTDKRELFESVEKHLKKLAYVTDIYYREPDIDCITAVTPEAKLCLPLADLVDLKAEAAKREKELAKAVALREQLSAKLANPGFTEKAPANVIEAERERLSKAEALIRQLSA